MRFKRFEPSNVCIFHQKTFYFQIMLFIILLFSRGLCDPKIDLVDLNKNSAEDHPYCSTNECPM